MFENEKLEVTGVIGFRPDKVEGRFPLERGVTFGPRLNSFAFPNWDGSHELAASVRIAIKTGLCLIIFKPQN